MVKSLHVKSPLNGKLTVRVNLQRDCIESREKIHQSIDCGVAIRVCFIYFFFALLFSMESGCEY